MLTVFSTTDKLSILSKLGSVVAHYPDVPMNFVGTIEGLFKSLPFSKAVLALGTQALEALQAANLIPKNRKVTGLRKAVMSVQGVPLMVSYSPTISEIDYGQFVDLLTDTAAAFRLAKTGTTEPKYGDYAYIKDFKPVVEAVKGIIAEHGRCDLALDIETRGLDRFHPDGYIISIQFTWKAGQGVMVAFSSKAESLAFLHDFENQKDLYWLLNCPEIFLCGANAKYDLEWIYEQTGITCTNFRFDTTLVGSLLDENRSNGLDVHAKIYAPELGGYSDLFDSKADKARMDLEYAKDPEAFLRYSCGDTDATFRVREAQRKLLLQDPPLAGFYVNILHPAARAYELVERGGVCVDKEEFDQLEADLIADLHRLTNEAKKILGGILVAKHYDPTKIGGLNLTKASLINDFMFSPQGLNLKPKMLTEKTKTPVTSMEHLEMFKDVEEAREFVNLLAEFSATNKTLNTYIVGFRQHIRSDGRMHPTYFLFAGNKDEGDGGTNCMPAGELVLTNRGYLPVEQVRAGDLVLTHKGRPRKVIATVLNGVQPVVKVTMSNGLVLRTTPNHAYRIGDGWVEAGKLVPGMQAWVHSGVEEWRPVPGWEDFRVSSWGRVMNIKTKRILTQYCMDKWGHLKVYLHRNEDQKRGPDRREVAVHTLVAEAFLGRCSGKEVRHLNGCSWDNTVGNLAWVSSEENRKDTVWHGFISRRNGTQVGLTAIFQPVTVMRVEFDPPEMTYGLTVEEDHSHVTGGIVTHNTGRISVRDPAFQTIPKHTKWGKRIRRCYNAPPGMLVLECVAKGSWVPTDRGLVKIEDVKPGDRAFVDGRYYPIENAWKKGDDRPTLKITTRSGQCLSVTPEHVMFAVRDGVLQEIQAKDLTTEDMLVVNATPVPGGVRTYSEEVAYLAGLFCGGGYFTTPLPNGDGEYSIVFSLREDKEPLLPLIKYLFEDCWGGRVSHAKDGGDVFIEGKPHFQRWKQVVSKKSSYDVTIPDWVFQSPPEVRAAFLAGAFDSGGSVHSGGLSITSTCKPYILQLIALAGSLGIYGKLRVQEQSTNFGAIYSYNFGIFSTASIRAFSDSKIPRKQKLIEELRKKGYMHCQSEMIPMGLLQPFNAPGVQSTPASSRLFSPDNREEWTTRNVLAKAIAENAKLEPAKVVLANRYDPIVSIEEGGRTSVYDLTIQGIHAFYANNIKCHNCDFSQGELKVIACLANEESMIHAYRNNLDLHVVTSSFVAGYTYEEMMELKNTDKAKYDEIRQLGKAGNFGLIYGMGVEGFIDYARTSYGVTLTYEQAEQFRTGFFRRYPGLLEYHAAYKAFAHKHGYVRSPLGRVRHLPLINSPRADVRSKEERRAINAPVQSTLSDMMMWAIAEQATMGWFEVSPCFGSIHDAGYYYIPEDNYEFYAKRIVQVMENLPFHKVGWTPQLKFTADAKVGPNMGDLTELKF